jgi:uncharacterized protein YggL (DUF469 family)
VAFFLAISDRGFVVEEYYGGQLRFDVMRKRLRKKKHLGEFQEFGVDVVVALQHGVDFDAFLDDFLCDAVEANGLLFGGGEMAEKFEGFLELGRRAVYVSNLTKVSTWLAADPRIQSFQLADPVDAWHGFD